MAQGIQFTNYVPTALVGVNSPSPTLAAEAVTSLPISTGAFPGNVFYLTEQQANQLSQSSVNSAPLLICHAGWYMVVQVDSAVTAANVQQGYLGHQRSFPITQAQEIANIPPQAVMTSADKGIAQGINPCVFLNTVTPGNFTIVQIAGDGSIFIDSGYSGVAGQTITYESSPNPGRGIIQSNSANITPAIGNAIVGQLLNANATANALNRVNISFPGSAL